MVWRSGSVFVAMRWKLDVVLFCVFASLRWWKVLWLRDVLVRMVVIYLCSIGAVRDLM